ncbi:hypothetical protein HCN44_009833 [Aphidius gifuensis]|uniref:Calponin-homology (CH) domain-containing protein n=1 Tax=Aphidius gifuensis TaxID=684658 RepID=A0A835CW61_APHGI|nr:filamin-B-like [Aphidius gifuensis]KAF7996048.1 hypothetical protein HCN44_009833 [Aphidius gifuensis]
MNETTVKKFDAGWKKHQQEKLTLWFNEHLHKINVHINNLETDLSDGIILIKLLEVLTAKKLPKYHEQPTFRSHKLENVGVALKFLVDENINIVNIDSSDIVDGNLKLILGLVHTIMFHYSISIPDWEFSVNPCPVYDVLSHVDVSKIKVNGLDLNPGSWITSEFTVDARATQEMVKNDYKTLKCSIYDSTGLSIENFITYQKNGLFKVEYTPFDLGKHSIELFYDNLPIPGSPFIINVVKICIPGNCRVYGPGLIRGIVNMINYFTIDLTDAGTGGLSVTIEGPIDDEASTQIKYNEDNTVAVEYVVNTIGFYDVIIEFGNHPIRGSPFTVEIIDD